METVKSPYWIRGILRWYFYWRTRKTRREEHQRLKSIEDTMETLAIELAKAKVKKNKEHVTIFNLSLFILTIEYDVSVIKFIIPFEMDIWHQRFLARQLAVLMYESTNDLLKLLGNDLNPVTTRLKSDHDLQSRIIEIRKSLNDFKSAYMSELNTIRNFSGAHRDKDAFEQLVVIRTLDVNHILPLSQVFQPSL